MVTLSPRRFFPRLSYINHHKAAPASKGAFQRWFRVDRYWSGRIIMVGVKHHTLTLDFRGNWLADMEQPRAK